MQASSATWAPTGIHEESQKAVTSGNPSASNSSDESFQKAVTSGGNVRESRARQAAEETLQRQIDKQELVTTVLLNFSLTALPPGLFPRFRKRMKDEMDVKITCRAIRHSERSGVPPTFVKSGPLNVLSLTGLRRLSALKLWCNELPDQYLKNMALLAHNPTSSDADEVLPLQRFMGVVGEDGNMKLVSALPLLSGILNAKLQGIWEKLTYSPPNLEDDPSCEMPLLAVEKVSEDSNLSIAADNSTSDEETVPSVIWDDGLDDTPSQDRCLASPTCNPGAPNPYTLLEVDSF